MTENNTILDTEVVNKSEVHTRVIRTLLTEIQPSGSTTKISEKSLAHRMVTAALHDDELTLIDAILQIRESYNDPVGMPNRRKYPTFSSDELNVEFNQHVSQTIKYLSRCFLVGNGFVRKTGGKCEGAIGIVTGVSFSTSPAPKNKPVEESSSDLLLPLGSNTPEIGVNFHLSVALPNYCATTWRVNQVERLPGNEGMARFISTFS